MGNWPYIISATKVRQHLKCERLPFMDAHREPEEAVDPQERLLAFDLGIRHEEEVGQQMRAGAYGAEASEPIRLPEVRGMEAARQTLDYMRAGHPAIEQGLLIHDNWWGTPDWLHRKPGSSNFGEWYYEPGDAKLGGRKTTIRSQVVPITFYALILERIQGVRPTHFTIYRTTPAVVDVSKHVDDALDVVKKLERVLGDGDDPGPWLTSECAKCKWFRACKTDARRTAHLSLITGMRRDLLPRLNALGIGTVNDLAKLPVATIERLPHIGGDRALRVLEQAKVYTDNKPRIVGRPRIPPRTKTEIYLDVEGQGRDNATDAVLFGLLIRRGSRATYWTSLANSPTDGRRAWRELCQHLRTLPRDCPVFHFGTYDAQLVRGLQARHGGAKDLERRLVDLHLCLANHVALPSRGTSLKAIAEALGFHWAEPDASGQMASLWWDAWATHRDRRARAMLLRHNKDDLRALTVVLDWARMQTSA